MIPGLFDEALALTLTFEGGYVSRPASEDAGGPTNMGITQDVYRAWKKDPAADVRILTGLEARQIYAARYWTPAGCDDLLRELAIVHFDAAVNSGLGIAAAFLKQATWADVPAQIAAHAYLTLRRRFLGKLPNAEANPGWFARIDALRKAVGL